MALQIIVSDTFTRIQENTHFHNKSGTLINF